MDITDDIVMEAITQLIRELYEQHKRPLHIRITSVSEYLGVPTEDIKPSLRSLHSRGLIRGVQGINNTFISLSNHEL